MIFKILSRSFLVVSAEVFHNLLESESCISCVLGAIAFPLKQSVSEVKTLILRLVRKTLLRKWPLAELKKMREWTGLLPEKGNLQIEGSASVDFWCGSGPRIVGIARGECGLSRVIKGQNIKVCMVRHDSNDNKISIG